MKESKSLSRFKKQAQEFNKLIEGKSNEEVERLVRTSCSFIQDSLTFVYKQFWKTLKHSAPVYGADVQGSLFDHDVPWNLAELDSILK